MTIKDPKMNGLAAILAETNDNQSTLSEVSIMHYFQKSILTLYLAVCGF